MVMENFSNFMSKLSLENIFSGDLSAFLPMAYLIIAMAIYAIAIWHFYRFIARRDCFKLSPCKHKRLIGFLKYTFLFPFVAFSFFIGFSLLLLFLTRDLDIDQVLSTAFAIIVAIRITAYYSEDLSKDLAKMLPFALLGLFLVDPSYFRWEDITAKVESLPEFFIN